MQSLFLLKSDPASPLTSLITYQLLGALPAGASAHQPPAPWLCVIPMMPGSSACEERRSSAESHALAALAGQPVSPRTATPPPLRQQRLGGRRYGRSRHPE